MIILTFYKDHSGCSVENGMEVEENKIKTGDRNESGYIKRKKQRPVTMIIANTHTTHSRCLSTVLSILHTLIHINPRKYCIL